MGSHQREPEERYSEELGMQNQLKALRFALDEHVPRRRK
jgi:hypothetical protein